MSNNTVHLHRVIATSTEKIYRAFLEAEALTRWLPPNGFTGRIDQFDAKVGGGYTMSFTNFTTGRRHSFRSEYIELVPKTLIRYNTRFDDLNLPGEMCVTVTLKQVLVGTEMLVTQSGIPEVIPVEACYLGWQESLRNLQRLVEPEINQ